MRLKVSHRTEYTYDEPIRYGLAHPGGTLNPLNVAFGECRRLLADMRSASSPLGALKITLGRP